MGKPKKGGKKPKMKKRLSNVQSLKLYQKHPEIRKMKKIFDDVDQTGSTRLDRSEFIDCSDELFPRSANLMGLKAWNSHAAEMFTAIDDDGGGDLSWAELINYAIDNRLADEWWMKPKEYEAMFKATIAAHAAKNAPKGPKQLKGPVPESLLKKRKTMADILNKRKIAGIAKRTANKELRKQAFTRARKYVAEYQAAERATIEAKRSAKNAGNYYVEPEAKVLLVVRIRGINRLAPKPKKILQLFRLRQLNNAVFVKVNHSTLTMLRCIEPYVTYGPPNLKTVRELLYKRGYAKVHRQRIPLNTNQVIANSLKKHDVLCMEDLIKQIVTCGPAFKECNNFLWPIKLSNPLGGWNNKGIHFSEGGDGGRRDEAINALVRRMN